MFKFALYDGKIDFESMEQCPIIKEGRMHDSICRVWLGRSGKAKTVCKRPKKKKRDGWTDGRTDQPTDSDL